MIYISVFLTLMSSWTYCAAQVTLTQPATESVTPGSTVTLPCTLSGYSISDRTFYWYLQKEMNTPPQYLLYYSSESSKGWGDGVSNRFSGSKDSQKNAGQLTIKGILSEDEGDIHCAIWYPPSSTYIIGNGTQLIIKTGEVKNPDVSLYPPSEEELKTGKASIVCTATNFAPRTAKLEWVVDGRTWNDDVSTTPISKQDSSGYMMSSILTMTASDYEAKRDNGKIIICKVTLEGKDFIKRLTRSECS